MQGEEVEYEEGDEKDGLGTTTRGWLSVRWGRYIENGRDGIALRVEEKKRLR